MLVWKVLAEEDSETCWRDNCSGGPHVQIMFFELTVSEEGRRPGLGIQQFKGSFYGLNFAVVPAT